MVTQDGFTAAFARQRVRPLHGSLMNGATIALVFNERDAPPRGVRAAVRAYVHERRQSRQLL
jgi:hypothetical protein